MIDYHEIFGNGGSIAISLLLCFRIYDSDMFKVLFTVNIFSIYVIIGSISFFAINRPPFSCL